MRSGIRFEVFGWQGLSGAIQGDDVDLSSSHALSAPFRLIAFLRTISCCCTLVWAISRSSLLAEASAAARVTSMGESVPISTDLPVVVAQKLLRGPKGLFLDPNVLVETDQIPIKVQYRRHRGDHLPLHLQVAHLDVVLGDAQDIAIVDSDTQTLQQVLAGICRSRYPLVAGLRSGVGLFSRLRYR